MMDGSTGSGKLIPRVAPRLAELDVLDGTVAELREIERRGGIERTFAIGELVLSRFFGGDCSAWRNRRRNKNNSIRRLAERKDCPLGRSALNDAVAVHVAMREILRDRTFGHVRAGHVMGALLLPPADRESLLLRAERERLSVRDVRKIAASLKTGRKDRIRADNAIPASAKAGVNQLREGIERLRQHSELSDSVRLALRRFSRELLELAG
jgi:hypothetical protein